jgi:hypothetical protein
MVILGPDSDRTAASGEAQQPATGPADTGTNWVYARGVLAYYKAGWQGVIPAWGPGDKRPVAGFTGDKNYGVYPSVDQIIAWCQTTKSDANLLLRLSPTLIGIDKDAYAGKTGARAMAEGERRWGTPPPTWRSTSRIECPNGSGIYIFTVPEGWRGRGEISFGELAIGDVEVIQHHHRTVCAWPSVHPKTGNVYRWLNPDGELVPDGVVPPAEGHPELPLEWLKGLANTKANRARERRRATKDDDDNDLPLADLSALLTDGRMSKDVGARVAQALQSVAEGTRRHESTRNAVLRLMGMGAKGHAGVGFAIRELNRRFVEVVGPQRDGGTDEADHEFNRLVLGAARLLDEGEQEAEGDVETDPSVSSATHATPQQSWSGPPPRVAVLRSLLSAFLADVRNLGVVGETVTVQVVFLALVSRLLDTPVSVGVKGDSASGKSWVVKKAVEFFPEDAVHARTAMSSKALVYSPEGYVHRTIVLYEVTGMQEHNEDDMTAYLIRTLLSENRIDYETTVRRPDGTYTTNRTTKEGPTNLIFTTTRDAIHAENETRVLSLNTDDSNEQTKAVMQKLAKESADTVDLQRWHDLQNWLASDAAEKRVTIPFAAVLSDLTPASAVRMRRDFGAILALIRAHAMLHQLNRDRDDQGRIVATIEDDYAVVRGLVSSAVSQGVGATVSATVRQTVQAVDDLAKGKALPGATVGEVAEHLKVDKSNAGRRLKTAARGGYIENQESRPGVKARWVVGEPLPDHSEVLPAVGEVLRCCATVAVGVAHQNDSDQDCCGVALDSGVEGKNGNLPPSEVRATSGSEDNPSSDAVSINNGSCPRCGTQRSAGLPPSLCMRCGVLGQQTHQPKEPTP